MRSQAASSGGGQDVSARAPNANPIIEMRVTSRRTDRVLLIMREGSTVWNEPLSGAAAGCLDAAGLA